MSPRPTPTRYVIVGDGAAGFTAVEYIRRTDGDGRIQIVCNDKNAAYYRAALTNYLIGGIKEAQLFAVPPDFFAGVERIHDSVEAVDPVRRHLVLRSGRPPVPYDRLLIATGASANPPAFPAKSRASGADLPGQPDGVTTLRTLEDARRVLEAIDGSAVTHAVVVGSGTLGLELVQAFHDRKVRVTYLLGGRPLCGTMLDPVCSDLVLSRLEAAERVTVLRDEEIAEARADRQGRLCEVRLKPSGQVLLCQIAAVATGVRPNVALVSHLGRDVSRGIPVNHNMCTEWKDVYAAGDVAALRDAQRGGFRCTGLWEPARQQGRVAGINMAGGAAVYQPGAIYHATRLWDLDLAAVGETNRPADDDDLLDFPKGTGQIAYRKLVIREGRLVGALLLGEHKTAVRRAGRQYKRLISANRDFRVDKAALLDPDLDAASWLDPDRGARPIHIAAKPPAATYSPPMPSQIIRPVSPRARLTRMRDGVAFEMTDTFRIGRARDHNDEPIDDSYVSSQHAVVEWCETGYFVRDLNSRNGTFVNQSRVTGSRALQPGDLIDIFQRGYRYRFDPADAPPGAPASSADQSPASSADQSHASPPGASASPAATDPQADMPLAALVRSDRRFPLALPETMLGRSPDAGIWVDDDDQVSWRHAQISLHLGELYLRDLGSTNGTYVNDRLVTTPHRLRDGDIVRLGPRCRLAFHCDGQAGGSTPNPQPFASIDPPAADPPAAPDLCPHCGRPARPGARFCAACGKPLAVAAGGGTS